MKAYNKESNIFELQHLKMKLCYMSKMSIKQESSQTVKKKISQILLLLFYNLSIQLQLHRVTNLKSYARGIFLNI